MSHSVDFGSVAKDYAKWRNDFPLGVFDQLRALGVRLADQRVVDLGCGSGVLSRELAKQGAMVTGIDPSPELLAEARIIDGDRIDYRCATAEGTNLPSACADVVTVLRAWHWFDRPQALAEVRRLLKNKGKLIVMDTIMDLTVPVCQKTLAIAAKYLGSEALKPPGSRAETRERIIHFPLNWHHEWQEAAFACTAAWEHPYSVTFTHEAWSGRVRTLSWYTKLSAEARKAFQRDLEQMLEREFAETIIRVPHLCTVVVLRKESDIK
ncbi:class I SAM-dependent methyltransferase [Laceyella putida]|uniref:Class I SAM-dependent methyltransferase n=1 Tax=Laceyella putida TaxID=110101 RepID=A0ABW2RHY3_9BACL